MILMVLPLAVLATPAMAPAPTVMPPPCELDAPNAGVGVGPWRRSELLTASMPPGAGLFGSGGAPGAPGFSCGLLTPDGFAAVVWPLDVGAGSGSGLSAS